MNGIIMNDKVHATDKTNLEIKVSKETFTQMIQDGTLIEGATYKVTGYDDDIVINSKQVGYDNTTSQLAATNSQDAIDEIKQEIENTRINYNSITLNNETITKDKGYSSQIPDGFEPLSCEIITNDSAVIGNIIISNPIRYSDGTVRTRLLTTASSSTIISGELRFWFRKK